MECKIIILVLSVEEEPYITLENNGIRETWGKNTDSDIKIIYYYGGNQTQLINDKLYINEEEGLYNIGKKTIKAFEYLYNNFSFEYLFRTNSSSYIDVSNMKKFLIDKPKEKYYDGVIGNHNGIEFCSGSGYFLSKDILKLIINNKDKWNHNYIDDVSLGLLLKNLNIKPNYKAFRKDYINGIEEVKKINNHYHYRVKTETNRLLDIEKMKKLKI